MPKWMLIIFISVFAIAGTLVFYHLGQIAYNSGHRSEALMAYTIAGLMAASLALYLIVARYLK